MAYTLTEKEKKYGKGIFPFSRSILMTLTHERQLKLTENRQENQEKIWDDDKWNQGNICPYSRYVIGYRDAKVDYTVKEVKKKVKGKIVDVERRVRRVTGIPEYLKIHPCGREDCPVCGRKNSMLHRQRVMRGIKKILCFQGMGYFVFTIPEEHRYLFREQSNLDKLSKYVRNFMKVMYFNSRGGARFHFGGDKHQGIYNPHLNALVDLQGIDGWISRPVLKWVKRRYKNWLKKEFGIELKGLPVVNYRYVNAGVKYYIKRLLFSWKYVCRPTLLLCKNDWTEGGERDFFNLVSDLHGFRNMRWWGFWEKEELNGVKIEDKREGEVADLSFSIDKDGKRISLDRDGKKIEWGLGGLWSDVETEVLENFEYVGMGYFRVRGSPGPPDGVG